MNDRFIRDVHATIGTLPGVIHEHTARHFATTPLNDTDLHQQLGWRVVKVVGTSAAFLQRPATPERKAVNLEFVPASTPEHEAWAVNSQNKFDFVVALFGFAVDADGTQLFELRGEISRSRELLNAMFRHVETGLHVQIIWRAEEMFPGTFEE